MATIVVPAPLSDLGARERQVLLMYGELRTKDRSAATFENVALAFGVSYHTIKNQLESARKKLGAKTSFGAYLKLIRKEARR